VIVKGMNPLALQTIAELHNKKDAICYIETLGGTRGTGFFLEINDANLPFKRGLLTANHVFDINKEIKFLCRGENKIIKITKNRRVFTDKKLDYTFIEILPEDNINFFFIFDDLPNNDLQHLNNQEIILVQHTKDDLSYSVGNIKQTIGEETINQITHTCPTQAGSSGSPILLRNNLTVIGIHKCGSIDKQLNYGIPILSIINNIKHKQLFIKSNDYKEEYNNLEKIGSGNYGTVYKGLLKNEKEYRAIKVIDKEEMKKRFKNTKNDNDVEEEFNLYIKNGLINDINEIDNMRICMKDNLNSIKFYEYYDTEKEYAIVMELCDNILQNILNEKKEAFNIDEVYDIISQLNNTFKIISENNIVHRDLKLENILVKYIDKKKSKFIVKLTDYGVSRKVLSISKKCNTYVGTVLTMAPEILAGEKYDNKCDLWSLGVIIYQLLFKEYPYDAETEVGLYNQINEFGDKYFKKTGEKQIDCLISKLLVKDPEKRLGWNDYFSEFSKIKKNNINDNNNCQIF
jgi:hypothetical protein